MSELVTARHNQDNRSAQEFGSKAFDFLVSRGAVMQSAGQRANASERIGMYNPTPLHCIVLPNDELEEEHPRAHEPLVTGDQPSAGFEGPDEEDEAMQELVTERFEELLAEGFTEEEAEEQIDAELEEMAAFEELLEAGYTEEEAQAVLDELEEEAEEEQDDVQETE